MDPVSRYLAGRYDVSLGGNSLLPYAPHTRSFYYRDLAGIYPYEMPSLIEYAEENGFRHEDMLMHMNVNHTFSDSRYAWTGMDRFDAFECNGSGQYVNGVYLVNGSVYIDKTEAAYSTKPADVPITDKLLLGYSEPFDEVNFDLAKGAFNVAVTWEYWNGVRWKTLGLKTDTTYGLIRDGQVRFHPPGDWFQKSENGSRKKWWIRAVVTGSGTAPVASRIYGDNWAVAGKALTWRGWDRFDGHRINVGLGALEYNPEPPPNASARFRYQARTLGIWANNIAFANHADIQRGYRTFAKYLVDTSIQAMQAGNYNGLHLDNGVATPKAMVSPSGDWQQHSEVAGIDYLDMQIGAYRAARRYLRARMPLAYLGVNSTVWAQAKHGDVAQCELASPILQGGIFYYNVNPNERAWNSLTYDQLLPKNNLGRVQGIFAAWEADAGDFIRNGEYMIWDRGDRGPMTALAAYYIVANENTLFSYNTEGWRYSRSDDFDYVNEKPDYTITSALTVDTSRSVKYLAGNFSRFPDKYNSPSSALLMRIGRHGEFLPVWKVNNFQLATEDAINFDYPVGTGLLAIRKGRLSVDMLPPVERIVCYGSYFPALDIDIGVPDRNGHAGGARDMAWKTPAEAGTAGGIQRRDFTHAIVLNSPAFYNTKGRQYAKYGKEIQLDGVYYRLKSDGTTGPAITSIRLRTGEGAVLLKRPAL